MSSTITATATADVSLRKCSFCAEDILSDARKCKHCGEFVNGTLSMGVGVVFAVGLVIACIMAKTAEDATLVGVWAIFALLFARTFGRR
jgi:hypothetical protein